MKVFDGKKEQPYKSYDVPNPINHYNRSKYYGELLVKEYVYSYILRAGWMFGGGPEVDKKFVNKIINNIAIASQNFKLYISSNFF